MVRESAACYALPSLETLIKSVEHGTYRQYLDFNTIEGNMVVHEEDLSRTITVDGKKIKLTDMNSCYFSFLRKTFDKKGLVVTSIDDRRNPKPLFVKETHVYQAYYLQPEFDKEVELYALLDRNGKPYTKTAADAPGVAAGLTFSAEGYYNIVEIAKEEYEAKLKKYNDLVEISKKIFSDEV